MRGSRSKLVYWRAGRGEWEWEWREWGGQRDRRKESAQLDTDNQTVMAVWGAIKGSEAWAELIPSFHRDGQTRAVLSHDPLIQLTAVFPVVFYVWQNEYRHRASSNLLSLTDRLKLKEIHPPEPLKVTNLHLTSRLLNQEQHVKNWVLQGVMCETLPRQQRWLPGALLTCGQPD